MKKLFLFFVSFTFFISCGDVNKPIDSNGTTKLMKAISEKENFSKIESLIKKGANVNISDINGNTALIQACGNHSDKRIVTLLIDSGANVNAHNKDGLTPLLATGFRNGYENASTLIAKGANINATDNKGRTALHYAAITDSLELVKLLIAKGSDITSKDMDGKNPIELAKEKNSRLVYAYFSTELMNSYNNKMIDTLNSIN